MRTKLEQLLALQTLQFDPQAKAAEVQAGIKLLRETFPAPIVAHYERMASRGRKCVAIVRDGVCSECHLLIPTGTLGSLGNEDVLHQCDNCGRYLYLPKAKRTGSEENEPSVPASAGPPKRRPRRTQAHVL